MPWVVGCPATQGAAYDSTTSAPGTAESGRRRGSRSSAHVPRARQLVQPALRLPTATDRETSALKRGTTRPNAGSFLFAAPCTAEEWKEACASEFAFWCPDRIGMFRRRACLAGPVFATKEPLQSRLAKLIGKNLAQLAGSDRTGPLIDLGIHLAGYRIRSFRTVFVHRKNDAQVSGFPVFGAP